MPVLPLQSLDQPLGVGEGQVSQLPDMTHGGYAFTARQQSIRLGPAYFVEARDQQLSCAGVGFHLSRVAGRAEP